jgi:hypothetical protein
LLSLKDRSDLQRKRLLELNSPVKIFIVEAAVFCFAQEKFFSREKLNFNDETFVSKSNQGDQIGRIFNIWLLFTWVF